MREIVVPVKNQMFEVAYATGFSSKQLTTFLTIKTTKLDCFANLVDILIFIQSFLVISIMFCEDTIHDYDEHGVFTANLMLS